MHLTAEAFEKTLFETAERFGWIVHAYVVMSNHQSHYDIPVLYQALDISLRMVAKRELFRIPLWAQAMRSAGFVELDRSDRERQSNNDAGGPQR